MQRKLIAFRNTSNNKKYLNLPWHIRLLMELDAKLRQDYYPPFLARRRGLDLVDRGSLCGNESRPPQRDGTLLGASRSGNLRRADQF